MGFLDHCCREKRKLFAILLVSLVLVPLCFLASGRGLDKYLMEGGDVVGIRDAGRSGAELVLEAERGGISVSKAVTLREKKQADPGEDDYAPTEEERLRTELDALVRSLAVPAEGAMELPAELSDGTPLIWKRPERGRAFLLPLLFAPLMALYGYRGEKDKAEKKAAAEADSLIRALPEFNNKIVLLLGSGMVFDDALAMIAAERKREKDDVMARLLDSARQESETLNVDMTAALCAKAGDMHVRDLSRMLNLIYENRYTGADLMEKLTYEGEALWAGRKKRAEEKGRKAETALALPMSVTLLALVAVTAAPAMMQM